jgi:hypothetical protein
MIFNDSLNVMIQYLQFASCAGEADEPWTVEPPESQPASQTFPRMSMKRTCSSYVPHTSCLKKKISLGFPQGTSIGLLLSVGVEIAVIGAAQGWASALEHFLVSSQACLRPRRQELPPPGGLWITWQALNGLVLRHHTYAVQKQPTPLHTIIPPTMHASCISLRASMYIHAYMLRRLQQLIHMRVLTLPWGQCPESVNPSDGAICAV